MGYVPPAPFTLGAVAPFAPSYEVSEQERWGVYPEIPPPHRAEPPRAEPPRAEPPRAEAPRVERNVEDNFVSIPINEDPRSMGDQSDVAAISRENKRSSVVHSFMRGHALGAVFSLFLTMTLTLVPSVFYAAHVSCPRSSFEVYAFALAASSGISGISLLINTRALGEIDQRAAADIIDKSRSRVKRAFAVTYLSFFMGGFTYGAALATVVTRYIELATMLENGDCPSIYIDCIIAGALLYLGSALAILLQQLVRQCINKENRK